MVKGVPYMPAVCGVWKIKNISLESAPQIEFVTCALAVHNPAL